MNSFLSLVSIALLISSSVSATFLTVNSKLESYSFDQYLKDFGLTYADGKEFAKRRELFDTELKRVISHNSNSKNSWKAGINKFSALTKDEKAQSTFGRKKIPSGALKNAKSSELPADFVVKPVSELPVSVDWREKNVVSTVKDQGHCGSCWAFASTATLESHVAINSGLLYTLSTQQMAMCAGNPDHCGGTGGCEGSTAELAFAYVAGSHGMFQEYQYSYVSYYGQDYECKVPGLTKPVASIDGYVKLRNNDYEQLMNAIATIGPISINVDASTWHSYSSGIFSKESCNQSDPDVNHVVVLVGYGEENGQKYWLVRNSWNAGWGEAGYIRLERNDNDNENCGMDTHPQDGVECADSPYTEVKVCGTCGAIYDSSYPHGAKAL
jgi:cathepsin L